MDTLALVRGAFAFLLGLTLALGMGRCVQAATTILPPGATCFQQATGPVSSGSVYMLVPGTTTPKNTWQDSGQNTLNTNPIQLDANGCAIIFGTGSYRQQVYTGPVVGGLPSGNLLYDVQTTDTSAPTSVFWAGTSGGTPNAITVSDAGFNNTDGAVINFLALNTNTGAATLNVSGGGAITLKIASASGPIAITSNCIVANNPISVVYSSTQNAFLLLTPCSSSATATAAVPLPGGYLTLSNDANNVIITSDTTAATTIYYTTYVSNQIPIWNGTAYSIFTFSQLQLALTSSNNLASTIYDVCVFSNGGVATLVTGPAWSNSGAGTSSRGTGAGTAQISRVNGLWVNTVQISGNNGASTFTIPANQCTYLGSIFIDSTAGQISNLLSFGTIRKWGVWNAYNRVPINLQQGIVSPVSYVFAAGAATWRASNNFSTNTMSIFLGLAEERVGCYLQQTVINTSGYVTVAIAPNWTSGTPTLSTWGSTGVNTASNYYIFPANNNITPFLGLDTVITVEENNNNAATLGGSQQNMGLFCSYRG